MKTDVGHPNFYFKTVVVVRISSFVLYNLQILKISCSYEIGITHCGWFRNWKLSAPN